MTANMEPRAHLTRRGRLLYKTGTYSNIRPQELAIEVKKGSQTIVPVSLTDIAPLSSNDTIHFLGAVLLDKKCKLVSTNFVICKKELNKSTAGLKLG